MIVIAKKSHFSISRPYLAGQESVGLFCRVTRGSNLVIRGNYISTCCVSETVVAKLQEPADLLCKIRHRNVKWFELIVRQFQGYLLYDCVGIFWY